MFITGGLLVGGLIWYFPIVLKNIFLSVLGSFALVFGIFSILLGWYMQEEIRESCEEPPRKRTWRKPLGK